VGVCYEGAGVTGACRGRSTLTAAARYVGRFRLQRHDGMMRPSTTLRRPWFIGGPAV
jgi:hypothetical protein